jgi:3-hydroxyacyl-CoA dehydrogenase/enoyl-CoA hydratase/3-hydroxybutyryl-CoA epimerase
MQIKRVAVIGAGAMGGGIAYVLSAAGLSVVVKDIEQGQLDLAREHVSDVYRKSVARGRLTDQEAEAGLSRVDYTLNYEPLAAVDLAIEAVPEDMRIKSTVLVDLDRICTPQAIFASNTSALSISRMGLALRRPTRMIGMHFFNPAHRMKLVEVIPGQDTAQGIVHAVVHLAERLGKTPVVVRDAPGFLVNRLLMPYLNEATLCLQEGTGSVREIDAAMGRNGFGWPMGPFELMDMLGLDVCHDIIAYLASQYGERMSEAPLLQALVRAGRLGAKTGGGFYDYPGRQDAAAITALIQSVQEDKGGEAAAVFSVPRVMARFVNEAFLCLEEKIAERDDIDTACILGLGMAVRMGERVVRMGPLAYATHIGLDVLVERLQRLDGLFGPRFRPAPALIAEMATDRRDTL